MMSQTSRSLSRSELDSSVSPLSMKRKLSDEIEMNGDEWVEKSMRSKNKEKIQKKEQRELANIDLFASEMKSASLSHAESDRLLMQIRDLAGEKDHEQPKRIIFVVNGEPIPSYEHTLRLLAELKSTVRKAVNGDYTEQKFLMTGTTPAAFKAILEYIYYGKVNLLQLGNNNGHDWMRVTIDLAMLAHKLKLIPFFNTIVERMNKMKDLVTLREDNVDEIYRMACWANEDLFIKDCLIFMDKKCEMKRRNHFKIDWRYEVHGEGEEREEWVIISLDKPRHVNYIQFLLSDENEYQDCDDQNEHDIYFKMEVFNTVKKQWQEIIDNSHIMSGDWQWFYFPETMIDQIRITCFDTVDEFNPRSLKDRFEKYFDEHFMCKRKNIDLKFDQKTGYLIPTHDAALYPQPNFRYYFLRNTFSYFISKAESNEKKIKYIYHNIGDNNHIEIQLPQMCMVSNCRFHLYADDGRSYSFNLSVLGKREEKYQEIGHYTKRKSWQTIYFRKDHQPIPVRWIKLEGIYCSVINDTEFAISHFECPSQKTKFSDAIKL